MNGTITIFDPQTGEAKAYKRYSARLPEFNAKYGPGTGYRVESILRPLTDLQPLRMAAVQAAVERGNTPEDAGLGRLSGIWVCRHTLIDSEGHVVCDARAAGQVREFKDIEVLETASHQRLMARVGFGGELFDDDENRDIEAAGVQRSAPSDADANAAKSNGRAVTPAEPEDRPARAAKPRPARKPRKPRKTSRAAEPAPEAPEAAPETTAAAEAPAQDASPAPAKDANGAQDARDAPPAMLRQLAQLAERVGETTPKVTTFADAKAELKRLNKQASGAAAS